MPDALVCGLSCVVLLTTVFAITGIMSNVLETSRLPLGSSRALTCKEASLPFDPAAA